MQFGKTQAIVAARKMRRKPRRARVAPQVAAIVQLLQQTHQILERDGQVGASLEPPDAIGVFTGLSCLVGIQCVKSGASMGVDHGIWFFLRIHVLQTECQDKVFQDIGVIAGVIGVTVAEHEGQDRMQSMDDTQGIRISKLMAERGLCSRREADAYIERGLVLVNGEKVTQLGTRAAPDAVISLAPEARATQARQVTILLHKPVGYVSGQAEDGHQPAITLISAQTQAAGERLRFQPSHLKGLAPAGRLDIDSTGLLVLTQDGRIARQLIGDDSTVDKEYLVRVEGRLDAQNLALLNHGLELDGKQLRPAQVAWANSEQLRFVLREGKKRQIRRMCELVGLRVTGLKRVRIGRVNLGDLPLGEWRFLREGEKF